MSSYIIASVDIHDPEQMKAYSNCALPAVTKYGGRYLSRGTPATAIEGEFPLRTITILEFPSVEDARKFWDSKEYGKCKLLREKCATARVAIMDVAPGAAAVPGYLQR